MPADSADVLFQGFIDSVMSGAVAGWLVRAGDPSPLDVELLVDGVPAGTGIADGFRDDVKQAGFGTGHHAFRLTIPPAFLDGEPHGVQVRVLGDTFVLTALPAEQVLGVPPPPPPRPAPDLPAPVVHRAIELSVIMPTYNRGAIMEESLGRYAACAKRVGAELIVIDDGSRDDTPERLRRLSAAHPNLVTERVPNGGPAHARNLAASMARGRLLVFVGDDVMPVDDDFLSVHMAAHNKQPAIGTAILGKISWPNETNMPVNFVMAHIQGEGQQQFGYRHMIGYTWLDWRLFYSSNISVKKALVSDWLTDGYDSSFYLAAFEDPEFAWRTTLRLREAGQEFGIYYVPAAQLVHYHPYTVSSFLSRQVSVGMMAQRFLELHPSRADDLGLSELIQRLGSPSDSTPFPVEHYFSVFEGLKSWALVIEHHYGLGQQNWHADLLTAIFQLGYFEGFIRVQSGPQVNLAAGCRYVLEHLRGQLNRAIATEALGDLPGFGLV